MWEEHTNRASIWQKSLQFVEKKLGYCRQSWSYKKTVHNRKSMDLHFILSDKAKGEVGVSWILNAWPRQTWLTFRLNKMRVLSLSFVAIFFLLKILNFCSLLVRWFSKNLNKFLSCSLHVLVIYVSNISETVGYTQWWILQRRN